MISDRYLRIRPSTIAKLLQGANAEVASFVRYEVGEGIEKKQEDFAAEVMAQIGK